LLPLGGVAIARLIERGSPEETRRPGWAGFAIQREQAPSPQKALLNSFLFENFPFSVLRSVFSMEFDWLLLCLWASIFANEH
jgi:hypothetical protein